MLNQPGYQGTASIVAEVFNSSDNDWVTKLHISDCERSIHLEIEKPGDEHFENGLYKIDTMISALQEMRKGLVKCHKIELNNKKRISVL